MMKDFFRDLLEYTHHYNQELWTRMQANQDRVPEKALSLFNHMLNSHHIWNHRIQHIPKVLGVWELHPFEELGPIDQDNYRTTLQILDTRELNEVTEYTTTTGVPYQNRTDHILFHIINHSTYHRGQIAMEFRQNGLEPLVADYVFYKR